MLEIEEDVLVAHLINNGRDAFIESSDIIKSEHLSGRTALFWNLCEMIFNDHDAPEKLTWTTLLSKAHANGFDKEIRENAEYFKKVKKIHVSDKEFLKACKKITLNGVKWDLVGKHQLSEKELIELPNDCSIEEIIATSEKHIFDYTSNLIKFEDNGGLIGEGATEFLENLGTNPRTMMGISTGYPIFDQLLGGGLLKGDVNFIAGRMGTGKSSHVDNIGLHISSNQIPVLVLDTELMKYMHQLRLISNMTGVPMQQIKNGSYYQDPFLKNAIIDAGEQLANLPFYFRIVAGMDFSEILAYIRKWIVKNVGFDSNGNTNDCLIIYDYMKLFSSSRLKNNIAEHQELGYMLMDLITLVSRYNTHCLSFAQLNRDGEDNVSLKTIGASDRIAQYAGSVSLWQEKNNDEISKDGIQNGCMKISVLKARHGPGSGDDYISYRFDREINRIKEVDLGSNLAKKSSIKRNDPDTENIPEL